MNYSTFHDCKYSYLLNLHYGKQSKRIVIFNELFNK